MGDAPAEQQEGDQAEEAKSHCEPQRFNSDPAPDDQARSIARQPMSERLKPPGKSILRMAA